MALGPLCQYAPGSLAGPAGLAGNGFGQQSRTGTRTIEKVECSRERPAAAIAARQHEHRAIGRGVEALLPASWVGFRGNAPGHGTGIAHDLLFPGSERP